MGMYKNTPPPPPTHTHTHLSGALFRVVPLTFFWIFRVFPSSQQLYGKLTTNFETVIKMWRSQLTRQTTATLHSAFVPWKDFLFIKAIHHYYCYWQSDNHCRCLHHQVSEWKFPLQMSRHTVLPKSRQRDGNAGQTATCFTGVGLKQGIQCAFGVNKAYGDDETFKLIEE